MHANPLKKIFYSYTYGKTYLAVRFKSVFLPICWQESYEFKAKILPVCWKYKRGFHFLSLHKIKMSKQHLSLTYRVIMLTILAKCSHACLLRLCGNREFPVSFQNKLVSSSLKWVPKKILFLAKLKGEERPFWTGGNQSYKLSLRGGGNVNYYKSIQHPIPTRGNREHSGNFQNK